MLLSPIALLLSAATPPQANASAALSVTATVVRPPTMSPVVAEGRSASLTIRNVEGISITVAGGTAQQISRDAVAVTATSGTVVISLNY